MDHFAKLLALISDASNVLLFLGAIARKVAKRVRKRRARNYGAHFPDAPNGAARGSRGRTKNR